MMSISQTPMKQDGSSACFIFKRKCNWKFTVPQQKFLLNLVLIKLIWAVNTDISEHTQPSNLQSRHTYSRVISIELKPGLHIKAERAGRR